MIYLSFFSIILNRSLLSLTSCFSLDLVQHLLVSFVLLYFVFFISSKVLFVIYFSNCFNCLPCFDSSVFFILFGSILKSFFFWTVIKVFLGIMSTSGTLIPTSFFLFHLSFLNQWCCCFVQLINICWASLQHLAVPFSL